MRKILFFTLLLISHNITSQSKLSTNYSYTVSEPYKEFDADFKIYFSLGNESMAVKIDKNEILIQKFNNNEPNFISEKLYKKYLPKNYFFEEIIKLKERYYFFYTVWDSDNKKEQLFYNEIDFAKGEFIGSQKLLLGVDGKIAVNYYLGPYKGGISIPNTYEDKFDFLQCNDKSNILIQYRRKPEIKRDTKSYDIIGLNIFDDNLNLISTKEVKMPYTERKMDILDYHVDKNSNLYILSKVFHDDSNNDRSKENQNIANYHIELFIIKSGEDKMLIKKIETNDKFINKLWLYDSNKDFVICGGYYNKGNGGLNNIDGLISFKVKLDGSIYEEHFNEIPLEIINQYVSEKTKKKNDEKGENAQLNNVDLTKLVVDNDGNMIFIGEEYYTNTNYSSFGNSNRSTTYFIYGDILITKLSPEGNLLWMKKIPKNQVGLYGKGGLSFQYFYTNKNHYLVYLDNIKNIDLTENQIPKQHTDKQGGYLVAVKINDISGNLSKDAILDTRRVEEINLKQFETDRVFKTSEGTFMFESYKKKNEDVMIKVILK